MSMTCAELRYNLGVYGEWFAVVIQEDGGFKLQISQGAGLTKEKRQEVGVFHTGNACVKYLRDLARRKFPGMWPEVDTLSQIEGRTGKSVVPVCFCHCAVEEMGQCNGQGLGECCNCIFRTNCVGPASNPNCLVEKILEDPQDSEDAFKARLRAKLLEKYGGTHD